MKRNLGLKLLSLLTALVLFVFINSDENTSVVDFTVPVELKNVPRDLVPISPTERQVKVSIKGPSSLVTRIASSPPVLKVRLPIDVDLKHVQPVRAADLALPPYVRVLKLEPDQIEVRFDRLATQRVEVRIPRLGETPEGIELKSLTSDPTQVEVTGPEQALRKLSFVESYPLDLRDLVEGERRELPLRPPAMMEVKPTTISVIAKLTAWNSTREFRELPIELRAVDPSTAHVTPSRVSVTLSGPSEKLAALTADQVIPYVRLRARGAPDQQLSVLIDLPATLKVKSIDPPEVRVVQSFSDFRDRPKQGKN